MAKYITLDGLGTFLSKLKDGGYKASTSEFGAFKAAGVRSSAISSTTGTTSGRYYGVEIDSNGKAFVNVPWTDTNTDTSTTLTGHYTPSENTGSTLSAAGGTLTDIANSSSGVQVVTGLKRDAKGHVVGVNSVALKSTNTTYSAATTGAAGLMSAADKTKLDGIATSANKYTLPNAGTASKPIYITGNTPTQCTSIDDNFISKSAGTSTLKWNEEVTLATIAGQAIKAKLPANPDTNSDTKVTQTVTTTNASYPLLLAPSGQTATNTTTSYFDSGVTLNPSTNTIAANISGNATSATSATNATNATNVNIATSASDASYPLLFTSNVTAGNKRIYTDSANDLSYNPSTNELSTNGDIRFKAGNANKYITFDSNDSLKNSWRIGYLGSGSGDGNYLTFESTQSTGTFVNALQISNVNLTSTFSGDVLPATNNAKNLGSSSLKWANAYATTFHGALDGNATSATSAGSATKATQDGSGRTITTTYSTTGHTHSQYSASGHAHGTITLSGDVTGSASIGSGTTAINITTTVADDSHNHTKLGTATKGSATQPIYLNSGTPTACTYTLSKSVPSDAKFTDTDTKVTSVDNHYKGSLGAKSSGLYKVAFDAAGHITGATTVAKTDITALGIPGSDTTYSAATTGAAGLMSAADKTKLDGIATGANKYTLPTAKTDTIGGIKVAGTRSSAITTTQGGSAGTYYGIEIDSNGKAFVNVPPVTTASTTTYGTVKLQSGELSGVTSHADSIAASYYHTHGQYAPKQHAFTGTTYGVGTSANYGHVKLISGDLNGKTAKNGEAAAAAHTHSQYALQSDMLSNEKVIASALNDLDTRLLNINRNAITSKDGITTSATDLVEGKAVYEYAAPKSHATSLSIYGLGTTANYGHVKISNGDVSTVATANGLAAGMDHYHSKTRISTTATNAYMPMLFVNATASGDTTIYIDSSTGTGQTSSGIRYNPSGNTCYCSGGFFEASDERLKNFGDNIEVDLDKLAQLPKKYFTWKHNEDGKVHIGTSAQELQKIYPELVDTLEDGTLIVSYDTLSVIALKGIDALYEKYKSLEERLNKIEKMLE